MGAGSPSWQLLIPLFMLLRLGWARIDRNPYRARHDSWNQCSRLSAILTRLLDNLLSLKIKELRVYYTHPLRVIYEKMDSWIEKSQKWTRCPILTCFPRSLASYIVLPLAPNPYLLFNLRVALFMWHLYILRVLHATSLAVEYSAPHEPYSGAYRRAPCFEG